MKTKAIHAGMYGLAVTVMLAACSGSISIDVDGPVIPPITPPVGNSEVITSHGLIIGTDELMVNGVRYRAGSASITINAQPGVLAELKAGHVVTITGRIDANGVSGQASSVRFDAAVIGPVDRIDAGNRRLTVMGQVVHLLPHTSYAANLDPDTLAGLSTGMKLQVSGFADADGAIRATRIEPAAANAPLQVIGRVAALDPANLDFDVSSLAVDYRNALLIDLPGGAPVNGMPVKVIGALSNGFFMAEQLVSAPDVTGISGQRVQLAGVITRFATTADFTVNDSTVTVRSGSTYVNGNSGDLARNAEVVIDGEFASSGMIIADHVTFGRIPSDVVILEFDLDNFSEISVPTVFSVTVTQGSDYSVAVHVDHEAAHRIDVSQSGQSLTIALEQGDGYIETLEARVRMPVLDRIDLTGVVNGWLAGFNQAQMMVNVGGVSMLSGADLQIGHLVADVSGVSRLEFGDIRPITHAEIDVGGISQATLNMGVGSVLSGSVTTGQGTGASALFYYGTDVSVNVSGGAGTSVVRLGATKP